MTAAPRSYLFAPGDRPDLMAKAVASPADAVIFDLEDSVADEAKSGARDAVVARLRDAAGRSRPVAVRVNPVGTSLAAADIAEVVAARPDRIRLPKVETALQVLTASRLIAEAERAAGIPSGTVVIEATLESAAGVLAVAEIARAEPRLVRLVFGSVDYMHDVAARETADELELLVPRTSIVLASRAAGLEPPVDGAYTRLGDLDGLAQRCRRTRALGFGAASAVHPAQLGIINAEYAPTASEVADAQRIVSAYEAAHERGCGVSTMTDGRMVDRPVVERARALLENAARHVEPA